MADAVASADEPMSHREVLRALTGLLAGFFAAMLSINIIVTALPVIVRELDGTQLEYSWVLTGTLLANAATTPIWGKLADLFDKKRLFQTALAIFTLGSLVAGLGGTMGVLILGRVIQGVGVGGLAALTMAIMGTIIAPRERGRYAGYMGATMATATAAGPLIGGLLVETAGWRWTFWAGIPVAILAMVIIGKTLNLAPRPPRRVRIDWLGATLLAAATIAGMLWLSFAGNPAFFDVVSWPSALLVFTVLASVVALIMVERRVAEPVMDPRIFRSRTTLLAIIASVTLAVLMISIPAYLGLYFQNGRGLGPTASGMLTLPLIFGNLIGTTVTGQLITRYGRWKIYLVLGSGLAIMAAYWLSAVDATTSFWLIGVKVTLIGLGVGMVIQNLMLAVQNTVTVHHIGAASAAIAFFRTVGGALGNSVMGAVMAVHVATAATASQLMDGYAAGAGPMFLAAALIATPALIAVLLIREVPLRRTV